MQRGLPQKRRIRDVGKVVAISSAKGGVGKSTIAGKHAYFHGINGQKEPEQKAHSKVINSQHRLVLRKGRSKEWYPGHRHLRPINTHTAQIGRTGAAALGG